MALKKTINYKGVTIENAYHRVWGISIDKELNEDGTEKKHFIKFGLGFHSSKENEMISSYPYKCDYDIDVENPIKQAYLYLKTLPEFADAVDC